MAPGRKAALGKWDLSQETRVATCSHANDSLATWSGANLHSVDTQRGATVENAKTRLLLFTGLSAIDCR
eukprot:CAMPEP_0179220444 /NCGR_PEP_ID=MMETSP0797-20121207/5621_1 /TAXON_ID=47934 /ORGANISM="Dinophysis acuminata, Strain DAEP01" /LENGTH=68 /DNA_ID=CAMNT_0020927081 /DNA_START=151 /DNA_END=353 /DNA_ORIENTATION=+